MTAALFPAEPNWKRTRPSAVCARHEHDQCKAYGCNCACHCTHDSHDEEG